jgi:hypothetical protein
MCLHTTIYVSPTPLGCCCGAGRVAKLPHALWHVYFVGSSPGSCDYQRYKSTNTDAAAAGTKARILTQLLAAQAVCGAAAGAQGSLQTEHTRKEGRVRCSHTTMCVLMLL